MDASEIKNSETLERWLQDRPRGDANAIGLRSALRVFPLWAGAHLERMGHLPTLDVARPLLTRGVYERYPSQELEAAARSATVAADREIPIVADSWVRGDDSDFASAKAAVGAASAAKLIGVAAASQSTGAAQVNLYYISREANVAYADTWNEIRADAVALQAGVELLAVSLWSVPPPDWFTKADTRTRAIWSRDPDTWEFWLRWWDGILAGKPLDWDLQRDVALIADEVWEDGPVAVKVEIDRIEINHIVNRTPHAEIIDRDASGQFFATPVVTLPPTVFQNAKDKVSDAVAEVRARLGHNQIAAILPDLDLLDRYSARYADNPLRLHDEFEKLKARIDLLVRQGELPPHDLIGDLRAALDSGAIDIRRSDKEVAKVIKGRTAERLGRLRKDRTPKVEAALAQAQAEARPDLRQELQEDLATADKPATNDAETTAQENAAYRAVSRMSRMAKRAKDDTVKLADDAGKVAKGVEAAGKAAEAAPVWWETVTNWLSGLFF